jgi:hypothetical protein
MMTTALTPEPDAWTDEVPVAEAERGGDGKANEERDVGVAEGLRRRPLVEGAHVEERDHGAEGDQVAQPIW